MTESSSIESLLIGIGGTFAVWSFYSAAKALILADEIPVFGVLATAGGSFSNGVNWGMAVGFDLWNEVLGTNYAEGVLERLDGLGGESFGSFGLCGISGNTVYLVGCYSDGF